DPVYLWRGIEHCRYLVHDTVRVHKKTMAITRPDVDTNIEFHGRDVAFVGLRRSIDATGADEHVTVFSPSWYECATEHRGTRFTNRTEQDQRRQAIYALDRPKVAPDLANFEAQTRFLHNSDTGTDNLAVAMLSVRSMSVIGLETNDVWTNMALDRDRINNYTTQRLTEAPRQQFKLVRQYLNAVSQMRHPCADNAPAKLRCACAAAIPPPTSRAPAASAGC